MLMALSWLIRDIQAMEFEGMILNNTVERYIDIGDMLAQKQALQHQHHHNHHAHNVSTRELHLMISITSGPLHAYLRQAARETWLLPCMVSPFCEYRFFVDAAGGYINANLTAEAAEHHDMVFRDNCTFINTRHPESINYGNCPPERPPSFDGMSTEEIEEIHKEIARKRDNCEPLERWQVPDYALRRLYKVDWKVCFMKWALHHHHDADFHVFVEDDSFMCTENLLHQVKLLAARTKADKNKLKADHNDKTTIVTAAFRPFIAGTTRRDGFDDAATFFPRSIAEAFAHNYPSSTYNCSRAIDSYNDPTTIYDYMWLSWGNSWQSSICDWREVLRKNEGLEVITPEMNCMASSVFRQEMKTMVGSPCVDRPAVLHHHRAAEILKEENDVSHICEYMLLIDKVKRPNLMFDLWNAAVEESYHDYSSVFLNNGLAGWDEVIGNFLKTHHMDVKNGKGAGGRASSRRTRSTNAAANDSDSFKQQRRSDLFMHYFHTLL